MRLLDEAGMEVEPGKMNGLPWNFHFTLPETSVTHLSCRQHASPVDRRRITGDDESDICRGSYRVVDGNREH
jgi:hypothetical protein